MSSLLLMVLSLLIYIVFTVIAFYVAHNATNELTTVPTVTLTATIAANNKYAASLIRSGAWVSLVSLLLVIIYALIFYFSSSATQLSNWYYLYLVVIIIVLAVAIVLIGVGIGYIDTSTNNTNSKNARQNAVFAIILLGICMLPLFIMIYELYSYNRSFTITPLMNNVEGIWLERVINNPDNQVDINEVIDIGGKLYQKRGDNYVPYR